MKFKRGERVYIKDASHSGPSDTMWTMVGHIHTIEKKYNDQCVIIKGFIWSNEDLKKLGENLADKSSKMFDVNNLLTQEN